MIWISRIAVESYIHDNFIYFKNKEQTKDKKVLLKQSQYQ